VAGRDIIQDGGLDVEDRLRGHSDGLLPVGGHLMEHVYEVPPRTIKDLAARFQVAVETAYASMSRRIR
jgi:hypothetical protein